MHAHQGRLVRINLALHQGDLFSAGRFVEEGHGLPIAAPATGEWRFGFLFDEMIMFAAIGDQIADRADLEVV